MARRDCRSALIIFAVGGWAFAAFVIFYQGYGTTALLNELRRVNRNSIRPTDHAVNDDGVIKVSSHRALPVITVNATIKHHSEEIEQDQHVEIENAVSVEVEIEQLGGTRVVDLHPLLVPPASVDSCAHEDFGVGLLERWKGMEEVYCDGRSQITCYRITQIRHLGCDNFCTMNNTLFSPSSGRFLSDCAIHPSKGHGRFFNPGLMPPDVDKWTRLLDFGPLPNNVMQVDDTPTILAYRDCAPPHNPFHCFGDSINLYFVLHFFNLDPKEVRILFMDHDPKSVWYDMYLTMAGKGVYTREEWSQWPQDVILTNVINNISPASSFIWKDFFRDTPCPIASPILVNFQQHLRRGLDLDAHKKHSKDRILLSLRTPTLRLQGNPFALKRLIANEAELIHGLQKAFPDKEIVAVDTGTLDFRGQVELLHSSSMLIGVHGAGMTLMMFMSRGASLVELFPYHPPHDGKPWCYANMAKWLGISYGDWNNPSVEFETDHGMKVNVDDIVAVALRTHQRSEDQKSLPWPDTDEFSAEVTKAL